MKFDIQLKIYLLLNLWMKQSDHPERMFNINEE